jgi:hypothetical protein
MGRPPESSVESVREKREIAIRRTVLPITGRRRSVRSQIARPGSVRRVARIATTRPMAPIPMAHQKSRVKFETPMIATV